MNGFPNPSHCVVHAPPLLPHRIRRQQAHHGLGGGMRRGTARATGEVRRRDSGGRQCAEQQMAGAQLGVGSGDGAGGGSGPSAKQELLYIYNSN
jgi:hypothetical protein